MHTLFSETEYQNAKSLTRLPCVCLNCGKEFGIEKREIKRIRKENRNHGNTCSRKCRRIYELKSNNIHPIELTCKNCNTCFTRTASQMTKSKNYFCSQSCSATYNNTHKTFGNRRSKLEFHIEQKLTELYPELDIYYNNKETIGSELDIYVPSLSLAFELNGIFHYEPIFGQDKLEKIQNNDINKYQACLENKIDLCIIDTSSQKYVKPSTSQKYIDIVVNILNSRLIAITTNKVVSLPLAYMP